MRVPRSCGGPGRARDQDWETVPVVVREMIEPTTASTFALDLVGLGADIDGRLVCGRPADPVGDLRRIPATPFRRSRIGLVVLQPASLTDFLARHVPPR